MPVAKPTATLTVLRTEWLTPHMVRVFFGDPGFDSFVPNAFTDAYAKLEFGGPEEPVLRTYTIRSVDPVKREIAIDFVVHGDAGVAGPWAASAAAGDVLRLRGPGGAFAPDPAADWYLLAGDETAIPAISASVEKLDASAVGRVIIEVAGPEDEIVVRLARRRRRHVDPPRRHVGPDRRRGVGGQRTPRRGSARHRVAARNGAGLHSR